MRGKNTLLKESSKIRVWVGTRGMSKRKGKRKESGMRPKEREI